MSKKLSDGWSRMSAVQIGSLINYTFAWSKSKELAIHLTET